jgi:adenosine deaminase
MVRAELHTGNGIFPRIVPRRTLRFMRDLALLPKAHLHVHLESTIRWATLRELGARNGVNVPGRGGTFAGFGEFAAHNELVRNCLRKPDDFTRIAAEFCADEAADGTRYAEVMFTAAAHGERLGQMEMPLEAVLAGLAEGQAVHDIECRVILDHSRRRSVDRAWQTLRLATRYAGQGVIALGLAGDEAYPLSPFAPVLDAARDSGLHLVHHAGESRGPDSIREAIHVGHAERLGHGIRALDDPALVDEIRGRALTLEVCPSSNVALGLAPSLRAHPLPRLRDAGLAVTVNTDIPAVIGTSTAAEYARVRDTFGYDDAVLAELARNAVEASFAPPATKTSMHERTDAWLAAPG